MQHPKPCLGCPPICCLPLGCTHKHTRTHLHPHTEPLLTLRRKRGTAWAHSAGATRVCPHALSHTPTPTCTPRHSHAHVCTLVHALAVTPARPGTHTCAQPCEHTWCHVCTATSQHHTPIHATRMHVLCHMHHHACTNCHTSAHDMCAHGHTCTHHLCTCSTSPHLTCTCAMSLGDRSGPGAAVLGQDDTRGGRMRPGRRMGPRGGGGQDGTREGQGVVSIELRPEQTHHTWP